MKIRIPESVGTWRSPTGQLYHFGTYDIPRDMPEEVAQLVLADGAAERVEAPKQDKKLAQK